MKELDFLLTRYLDGQYASAAPEAQAAFRELLECQDPLIHAYCMGRERPPGDVLSALIQRIIAGTGIERE